MMLVMAAWVQQTVKSPGHKYIRSEGLFGGIFLKYKFSHLLTYPSLQIDLLDPDWSPKIQIANKDDSLHQESVKYFPRIWNPNIMTSTFIA